MPRALCGVPRGTLENLRKSLYQLRDLAWSDPDPWSPYPELPHPVLGAFGPSLGNTSGPLFKIVKALPLCKGRENLETLVHRHHSCFPSWGCGCLILGCLLTCKGDLPKNMLAWNLSPWAPNRVFSHGDFEKIEMWA